MLTDLNNCKLTEHDNVLAATLNSSGRAPLLRSPRGLRASCTMKGRPGAIL